MPKKSEIVRLKEVLNYATSFHIGDIGYREPVMVEKRDYGWIIRVNREVLNLSNEWEYDPLPEYRLDSFKKRTGYNRDDAIKRAENLVHERKRCLLYAS